MTTYADARVHQESHAPSAVCWLCSTQVPWWADARRKHGLDAPPYDRRPTREPEPVRRVVHGVVSTYTNHACRCDECRQAATEYARERRKHGYYTLTRSARIRENPAYVPGAGMTGRISARNKL